MLTHTYRPAHARSSQYQDRLPQNTVPLFLQDMLKPWVWAITDIKVHTTVPSLSGGDTQDGKVKQSFPLAMTAERYPQEACIYVLMARHQRSCQGRSRYSYWHGQKATASTAILCTASRSPQAFRLHCTCFRSWLQAGCHPLRCSLHPASISKQVLTLAKSPTGSCSYHKGCSAANSSPLWNIGNKQADILAKGRARGELPETNICFRKKYNNQMPRKKRDDCHLLSGRNKWFWRGFILDITD